MRCITAIWPAGPPKLRSATRSQTRNASPSETPWAGGAAMLSIADACDTKTSCSRLGGRRALRGLQAAPGVERVVHDQAVPEHLVIVGVVGRQAVGDGEQAFALRREVRPR